MVGCIVAPAVESNNITYVLHDTILHVLDCFLLFSSPMSLPDIYIRVRDDTGVYICTIHDENPTKCNEKNTQKENQ